MDAPSTRRDANVERVGARREPWGWVIIGRTTRRAALLWALSLVAWVGDASAQTSTTPGRAHGNRVFYDVDLTADQVREDLLVPSRWAGPGLGLGLGWGHRSSKGSVEAELGFAVSYVLKSYGDPGVVLTPRLRFETLLRVFQNSTWRVELGPGFRSRIDDAFLFSWDDVRTYYLSTHMAGISGQIGWSQSGLPTFLAGVRLHLLGLAGRPDEIRLNKQDDAISSGNLFAEPNSGVVFATLPEYASFDLSLGVLGLGPCSRIRLDYVFSFERYSEPRPFSRLANSLRFTHVFELGGAT